MLVFAANLVWGLTAVAALLVLCCCCCIVLHLSLTHIPCTHTLHTHTHTPHTHTLCPTDILAHIMNDLFGGVVYAGIDTDRYKYPIGSGRVTFGNQKSFMKAVKAGFVEIKTPKFNKKVRVG